MSWPEFLAKTPMAEQARKDVARIESKVQPDYMPGLSSDEKKQRLVHMSYQDFLLNVAKVHADAAWFRARERALAAICRHTGLR